MLSVSEMVADNCEAKSVSGVAWELEKIAKQAKSPKADNGVFVMRCFKGIIVFNLQRTRSSPVISQ